ncbi:MAG: tail fiber domain-containing protein [Thermodesulfovibrionales bacterium]
MKKLLVVILAVVAITGLLVVPSFGADKLLVKDATSATRFVVKTDDTTNLGSVGVNVAAPAYNFDVSAGNVSKSSLHFSLNGTDTGGYITSVLDNNFFLSSGAAWDNVAGGWVAKSTSAVAAGTGGQGYRVFLSNACTPGVVCAGLSTPKFRIDYAGNAYATSWNLISSRQYKDNIQTLTAEKATDALKNLNPVTFTYKLDPDQNHVGFIAEDVPDLVAAKDRKSLSPMDIVAVLTKVVQEQSRTIDALSAKVDLLEKATTK